MTKETRLIPGDTAQHPVDSWCKVQLSLDGKTVWLGKAPGTSFVSHQLVSNIPTQGWWPADVPGNPYAPPQNKAHPAFPVELRRDSDGAVWLRWR
jgi:hypothetical protein